MTTGKIKAVITKIGLDSHERGAKLVASALRDSGMEVVYLGSFQTPESIINTAVQEDADIIGVSCHSGEHLTLVPMMMDLLHARKFENIPVIVGGVIPKDNIPDLLEIGVKGVFGSGTLMEDVVEFVRNLCE
jgi:methylmalonyl-CoA mutase C-terminal domain/subunit